MLRVVICKRSCEKLSGQVTLTIKLLFKILWFPHAMVQPYSKNDRNMFSSSLVNISLDEKLFKWLCYAPDQLKRQKYFFRRRQVIQNKTSLSLKNIFQTHLTLQLFTFYTNRNYSQNWFKIPGLVAWFGSEGGFYYIK